MSAAAALCNALRQEDAVIVATGFVFPPWRTGELDGVVGASVIARALEMGLGARPILVVEPELVPAMTDLIRTAGLQPTTEATAFQQQPHTALIVGFPKDETAASTAAADLLHQWAPKAMIAIERPGRNHRGTYHMGNGVEVTDLAAKIDILFEAVAQAGGLTVAIGDLGNELGLGSLEATVRAQVPFGAACQCPCGGGIAASVPADKVITAAVSDWAGYALAAALGFRTGRDDAFIAPALLGRLLQHAVDVGLIDGSGYAIPAVDGIGLDYNMRLAALLHDITTLPRQTKERFARMFDMRIELDRQRQGVGA